jgi:hypothetical protein
MVAFVDDEDYPGLIAMGRWQARKGWKGRTWHASTDSFDKCFLMHRVILGIHKQSGNLNRVDHIDKNGLNNQKNNLRLVSPSLNACNRTGLQPNNTSGITGVWWNTDRQVWQSEIRWEGGRKYLGAFKKLEDAAAARFEAERKYWSVVK